MYPLTEVSSSANAFMAACMRSKDVDFHRKSTLKPVVCSTGAPAPPLSSSPTSSIAVNLSTEPWQVHVLRVPSGLVVTWRSCSSSPIMSRVTSSSEGKVKYAILRLLSPTSHRTVSPSLLCDSFCCLS